MPGDGVLFLRFSLLVELNLACIAAIFRLLAVKSINAANLGAQAIFSLRFCSLKPRSFAKTLFVRFFAINRGQIYMRLLAPPRLLAGLIPARSFTILIHALKCEIAFDLSTRIKI